MAVICNICGGSRFADMGSRTAVRCVDCGSLERTRVAKLFLDRSGRIAPGSRVLHLAPEKGICDIIRRIPDVHYDLFDFAPEQFPFAPVKRFDLVTDVERLPSNFYDVVIHSHVMEHVPCNVTAALFHLHRAMKGDGVHLVCVPIMGATYASDLGTIPDEERVRRFGQNDHVRRFGATDLHLTLGMIFSLPECYDLEEHFPAEVLDRHGIPEAARRGFSSHTVFCFRKGDLKLK